MVIFVSPTVVTVNVSEYFIQWLRSIFQFKLNCMCHMFLDVWSISDKSKKNHDFLINLSHKQGFSAVLVWEQIGRNVNYELFLQRKLGGTCFNTVDITSCWVDYVLFFKHGLCENCVFYVQYIILVNTTSHCLGHAIRNTFRNFNIQIFFLFNLRQI